MREVAQLIAYAHGFGARRVAGADAPAEGSFSGVLAGVQLLRLHTPCDGADDGFDSDHQVARAIDVRARAFDLSATLKDRSRSDVRSGVASSAEHRALRGLWDGGTLSAGSIHLFAD